ncbi:MAG: COX15/CtaA family protein [Anaerolineales bacterium]
MKLSKFAKYAWFVLAFNLGVILWGAYVRATGSGAGCGSHWPLCNGEVIPRSQQIETLIEFTHRTTSGIAFLLVLGMLIWAWRIYPIKHRIRWGALVSMVLMITEALVGAGLVLFELVAENTSTARAISISIHLVNTFLLLAFITLTAWWASGGESVRLRIGEKNLWLLLIGLLGVILLGMSGALTALGDTLFPAANLEAGLRQDFSPAAHFLIRLRILHPTIAVIVSLYLILIINWITNRTELDRNKVIGRVTMLVIMLQLMAGLTNIILLAPVWLQLVHLFLADLIWIGMVLFSAATLIVDSAISEAEDNQDIEIVLSSTL